MVAPKFLYLAIAAFILGLASGCHALAGPDLPAPLPNAVTQTVPAGEDELQASPTSQERQARLPATPAPQRTEPTFTSTPELPASPTPVATLETDGETGQATGNPPQAALPPTPRSPLPALDIPYAPIQIISPGPASKVASPFVLRAQVPPGPKGIVRIELLGEDGRLLMREVKSFSASQGWQVNVAKEVTFGISAVAEAGRLQISVEDENGQVMALASVDLILLSIGDPDLNPSGDLLERIVIQAPEPDVLVQGGTLRVSGLARPLTEKALMVELRAVDGRVLGSRQVEVILPDSGGHGIYAIDVPYTVNEPTPARLFVWELGERIPGIAYLSSLELLLSP